MTIITNLLLYILRTKQEYKMKNKHLYGSVVFLIIAIMFVGCASLGDWHKDAEATFTKKYDEFTDKTTYAMKEAGLYCSVLPIKLEFVDGKDEPHMWKLIITKNQYMKGADIVTECSILNSRNERFLVDFVDINWGYMEDANVGYTYLSMDEVEQLCKVFSDIEHLDYIKIRFNSNAIYEMTQPEVYAVTYFVDQVKAQAKYLK